MGFVSVPVFPRVGRKPPENEEEGWGRVADSWVVLQG